MKVVKNILLAVIIIALLYFLVTCAWQQCSEPAGPPEPPPITEAPLCLVVEVTGATYYARTIDVNGTVYTMRGYWEVVNGDYQYRDIVISIDEKYFGPIKLIRR